MLEGLSVAGRNAAYDVQAGAMRRGKLAQITRLRLSRQSHHRRQIHRRNRNHKQSGRRMTRISQTPDLTIAPFIRGNTKIFINIIDHFFQLVNITTQGFSCATFFAAHFF